MGSTSAEERRMESKRGGAARTERLRPPGEASTTGAAQRALVLEPGSFRYAYRTGLAARCRDIARSLENRMETTTSVLQTREDGALSLRTSRVHRQRIVAFSHHSGIVHVVSEHCAPSHLHMELGPGKGRANICVISRDDSHGLARDEQFGLGDLSFRFSPAHNEVCRGHSLLPFRRRAQQGHNRWLESGSMKRFSRAQIN